MAAGKKGRALVLNPCQLRIQINSSWCSLMTLLLGGGCALSWAGWLAPPEQWYVPVLVVKLGVLVLV